VADTYNPSYSGGRDQEDHGLKPIQASSSRRPYLEKSFTKKRASGLAQGKGPESSNARTARKKKKKKKPS
jgi:hypothetical protein